MWQGTPSHHCAKSFTLIELLLTLALQATFSTVAYLLTALMDKRNRGLDLQRWLREIRRAVDACKEASHDSRLEKTVSDSVHPPSLQVLIERGTSQHLRLHTKARQAVLRDHSSSIRQTLGPYRAPPLSANPSGAPLPASGLCSPTGRHGQMGWRAQLSVINHSFTGQGCYQGWMFLSGPGQNNSATCITPMGDQLTPDAN